MKYKGFHKRLFPRLIFIVIPILVLLIHNVHTSKRNKSENYQKHSEETRLLNLIEKLNLEIENQAFLALFLENDFNEKACQAIIDNLKGIKEKALANNALDLLKTDEIQKIEDQLLIYRQNSNKQL